MSKANVQALSILGSVNSGIVTCYNEYPDMAESVKEKIVEVNAIVREAFNIWNQHDNDAIRVTDILEQWEKALTEDTDLGVNPNLTVLLIMSQTACQNLLDYVKTPKKVKVLEDILDGVEDLVGYLLDGLSDKVIQEKIDKAEELLQALFEINGFEPMEVGG